MDYQMGIGKADNSPWIPSENIEKSLPKLYRYG
jgi:hypothetical protein